MRTPVYYAMKSFVRARMMSVGVLALIWGVGFAGVGCANGGDAVLAAGFPQSGPTLHLGYSREASGENPLADFMYFIPLISTEPVMITSSSNANQFARVLSFVRKDRAKAFKVICEFELTGAGYQHNVIDQTAHIQRRERWLKSGKTMQRVLASIDVQGAGRGMIEVDGVLADGKPVVNEVRFAFNAHDQSSPVSIMLEDICYAGGKMVPTNEMVARVNTLTFTRKPGEPTMDVTVASVKPQGARDTFWQNFKGSLKGGLVNMFIPPLTVTSLGHGTMLDFGAALVAESPAFTFPLATNILQTPVKR